MFTKIRLTAASLLAVWAMIFAPAPARAFTAGYYANTSAMATGHWARVQVDTTGVYQVTYDQLRQLGFENPEKVTVCGFGGTYLSDNRFSRTQPDDIQATLTVHTADGRVLFYAEGNQRVTVISALDGGRYNVDVARNYYSTPTWYLLTDADMTVSARTVPFTAPAPDAVAINKHLSVALHEPEEQNPSTGGVVFHSRSYSGDETAQFSFAVKDFDGDASYPAYLYVQAAANEKTSMSTYTMPLTVDPALAAIYTSEIMAMSNASSDNRYNVGEGEYTFLAADATSPVADGTYTFGLTFPATANLNYAAMDRAVWIYPRKNTLDTRAGGMMMQYLGISAGNTMTVDGATASTRVFNVTSSADVYSYETSFDPATSTLSFTTAAPASTSAETLVAFDPEAQQLPVSKMEVLPNQNIHGGPDVAMLIITTEELYPKACELAQAHRDHNNLEVAVYTQQQIFNEFSSATPAAMGYRRAVKMFFDRDPNKFKYVLLYGAGSFDNRDIVIHAPYERLLVYEIEPQGSVLERMSRHTNLNFASDNYFGMVQDSYDPTTIYSTRVDVAVGRLPVESIGEATDINDKLIAYMTGGASVQNYSRVLLISDDGDANQHLKQSQELGSEMLSYNPALTIIRAHNSIYPRPKNNAEEARKLVRQSLLEGVGYFSYTGHGRPTYFTKESIWAQNYVSSTRYPHAPIVTIASCDTYQLDRNELGIAEQMVKFRDGGAIAAVAACRSVYLDYNQHINLAMATEYSRITDGATVGDIFRRAFNSAITSAPAPNGRINTMCYNLCGDPALRLPAPTLKAYVTSINGRGVYVTNGDEQEKAVLNPMEYLDIAGIVTPYEGGEADESFNGKATITLYDGAHTVPVIILTSGLNGDLDEDIELDENTLATATVDVVGGSWNARILVPYPTYPAESNRIVVGAEETATDVNPRFALGIYNNVQVQPGETAAFDGSLPEITEFYLNTPEFTDGDLVNSTFTVKAQITLGDGGLNKSTAIGAPGKLILDGNTAIDGANNSITLNMDNTATLSLPLSNIEDGRHTLTLTVADNAGNRVSRTLGFTVMNNPVETALVVEEKTAREYATLSFEHNYEAAVSSEVSTRLVIRDEDGATVHTVENPVFPYRWNLKDTAGNAVADGRYTAFVTSRSGNNYSHTTATQIVVVK